MVYAYTNGYNIVRLFQEEIYNDAYKWEYDLDKVFEYIRCNKEQHAVFIRTLQLDLYQQHINDFILATHPNVKIIIRN